MAPLRKPTTGIAACCARAVSGIAARPPSRLMNSRRLIRRPRGFGQLHRSGSNLQRERLPAPMSALGQEQTFALHQPMSVLPPKADSCTALAHVRFGPLADIAPHSSDRIAARPLAEERRAEFRRPLLRAEVHVHQSETIAETCVPLEIIHRAPLEVAPHGHAVCDCPL